jgi:hypothetical protein
MQEKDLEVRKLTRMTTLCSDRTEVVRVEGIITNFGDDCRKATTNYSRFNPPLDAWLCSDHLQKEALLLDTFMELGVPSIDGGLQSSGEVLRWWRGIERGWGFGRVLRWARVSRRCPRRIYRAQGGQSRDFSGGNGPDAAASSHDSGTNHCKTCQ